MLLWKTSHNRWYHPLWEDLYRMGREYHRLPLWGKWCRCWMRELWRPQIVRPGHEGYKGWQRTFHNIKCASMTCSLASCLEAYSLYSSYKKVPCCEEDTVHGHCQSGKGIIYPDMLSGGLYVSLVLGSGWYASYRACVKLPDGECMLVVISLKSSLWKWEFTKALALPLTIHHVSESPLPRVSHRMSMGKPVCRWPGLHLWITGWTAREADLLKIYYRRKWNLDQHEQNQGPDIWARTLCVLCGSWVSAQNPSSEPVVPVESTNDTVVFLALWSTIPPLVVIDVLDWPDQ